MLGLSPAGLRRRSFGGGCGTQLSVKYNYRADNGYAVKTFARAIAVRNEGSVYGPSGSCCCDARGRPPITRSGVIRPSRAEARKVAARRGLGLGGRRLGNGRHPAGPEKKCRRRAESKA